MGDEIDVEELVHNIETTGHAGGDPTPEPAPKEAGSDPANTEKPSPLNFADQQALLGHQLKYNANGKEVSEDIATILKRASQGYHYAQRMNELNTKETEWKTQVESANGLNDKWSKFENFAKENPEWYDHWSNAWENRQSGAPQTQDGQAPGEQSEIDAKVAALVEQKIAPMNEFLSKQQQEEQNAKIQDEDKQLGQQIETVRKAYPDVDLDASDPETGKTLEHQVLEFGIQKGIKDFDHAFKVFYHDQLVARRVEQAQSEATKRAQRDSKLGILGYSPTPSQSKSAPNIKNLNYDQLSELAAKDLGLDLTK